MNTSFIRHIKRFYYKIFGRLHGEAKVFKRKRLREKLNIKPSESIKSFREFEASIHNIKYPRNDFNKIMSMLLGDIERFDHIISRYRHDRVMLSALSRDDRMIHTLCPDRKSYPAHPFEVANNSAVKIDAQSLFIFGNILVVRTLFLLRMYLPSEKLLNNNSFKKIGTLHNSLAGSSKLENDLNQQFKIDFEENIKWLYAVLRFYRNEFIEHLNKGYQQGTTHGFVGNDFTLSSYKWNYNGNDDKKIKDLRHKLEKRGVIIPYRDNGYPSQINRSYLQSVFKNITAVPNDLLKEALDLIEDVGGESPQPELVISNINEYMCSLFNFMRENIEDSELEQYRKV